MVTILHTNLCVDNYVEISGFPSSYAQPRATPLHITWSLFEVGRATKTIFCRRRDVCDGQNAPTVRLLAILYS